MSAARAGPAPLEGVVCVCGGCQVMVCLDGVEFLFVEDAGAALLRVRVRGRSPRPVCGGCGARCGFCGPRRVELADLPVLDRAVRLVWHKRRWRCPNPGCEVAMFTEQDPPDRRPSGRG